MKICILAIAMIVSLQPAFAVSSSEAGEPDAPVMVDLSDVSEDTAETDELLVLVEEGTRKAEISDIADNAGASLDNVGTLEDGTKLAKVSFDDPEDMQDIADSLIEEDKVLIVQPNYIYYLEEEPATDDSYLDQQWYLGPQTDTTYAADVFAAWDELSDDTDAVTVAVIDTGAKLDHPDLGNILADKCVTFNDGKKGSFTEWDDSDDDNGHGTHVCGILAAETGNGIGVAGVSFNKAQIIVIDAARVGSTGKLSFSTQDCVMAITYAREEGVGIINMSLGGIYKDYVFDAAVDLAYDHGCLCVCAAGNESSDLPENPGDARGAVSVMSHNRQGSKASSSNYGPEKDVSAPGVSIYNTYINKTGYTNISGTSMATPVVSGIAALLLAEDSSLDPRQLKNLIYTSGETGTYESGKSGMAFGRVNAANAVKNLKSTDVSPESLVLNRDSISMYEGESLSLEFAVYPGAASRHASETIFSSDNENVAVVDDNGVITAVGSGNAVITVICGGAKNTCDVEVKDVLYETMEALPFETNGALSPTDPFVKLSDSYGSYCDGYEVELAANESIGINMVSVHAQPYIRILDSSGNILDKKCYTDDDKEKSLDMSFFAESAGKYRIYVMSYPNQDTAVDKEYTLKVHYHTLDEIEATPATCTADGNEQYYKCSICNAMFSDAAGKTNIEEAPIINKLGHDYGDLIAEVSAECLKSGMKAHYKCSNCNALFDTDKNAVTEESLIIEALGHDPIGHEAVSATCTTAGNSAYWSCSRCEKYFSDQNAENETGKDSWVIEAPGHSYGAWQTTTPATEDRDGVSSCKCSVCGATMTKRIEMLPPSIRIKTKALKPKAAKGSITVRWKAVSKKNLRKISGYQIQYAASSDFSDAKYVKVGKKNKAKKISKLAKKTTYYVRVRTYKGSARGSWSKVKTVKTR